MINNYMYTLFQFTGTGVEPEPNLKIIQFNNRQYFNQEKKLSLTETTTHLICNFFLKVLIKEHAGDTCTTFTMDNAQKNVKREERRSN